MMEEIAKVLCEQKDVEDDNMKLYLAQSLADVVKMGTVNGEFLLKTIDVCYSIYMSANSGATRESAEEALKEIMSFLMQSMDYVDKTKDAETINTATTLTPTPFPEEDEDDEEGEVVRGFTSDCMYTGVENSKMLRDALTSLKNTFNDISKYGSSIGRKTRANR